MAAPFTQVPDISQVFEGESNIFQQNPQTVHITGFTALRCAFDDIRGDLLAVCVVVSFHLLAELVGRGWFADLAGFAQVDDFCSELVGEWIPAHQGVAIVKIVV